jgi:hypothetical protein
MAGDLLDWLDNQPQEDGAASVELPDSTSVPIGSTSPVDTPDVPAANSNVDLLDWLEPSNTPNNPREVLDTNTSTNPTEERQKDVLSQRSGLPKAAVEGDPEAVAHSVQVDAVEEKTKDSPVVRDIMFDALIGQATHDDLDFMTVLETLTKRTRDYFGGGGQMVGGGTSGLGAFNKIASRNLNNLLGEIPLVGPAIESAFEADILPRWASPTTILKDSGETVKAIAKSIDSGEDSISADIARGLGQFSAQIAVSILSGGIASTTSTLSMFGQGVDTMSQKKPGDEEASQLNKDISMLGGGAITTLLERSALEKILNRVPPKIKNTILRQVADIGIAAGWEAAQEVVEGILQNITHKLLVNPEMSTAAIFQGLDREAIAAGGTGAIMRAFLNAITKGKSVSHDMKRADASQQYQQRIQAVLEASDLSVTAKENPAMFQQVVERIVADTDLQEVSVSAAGLQAAAEASGDPQAAQTFFEDAGVDPKDVARATELGLDIPVKTGDFIQALQDQEIRESVLLNVREEGNGLTLAESQVNTQDLIVKADKVAQDALAELDGSDFAVQVEKDAAVIAKDFATQAKAAGASKANAESVAQLVEGVVISETITRAAAGDPPLDIRELYETFNLKIEGGTFAEFQSRPNAQQATMVQRMEQFNQGLEAAIRTSVDPEGELTVESVGPLVQSLENVEGLLARGDQQDNFIVEAQNAIRGAVSAAGVGNMPVFAQRIQELQQVLGEGQINSAVKPDTGPIQQAQELGISEGAPPVRGELFQGKAPPKRTRKAYKLFRVDPKQPGKLFPLFVDSNTAVEIGAWTEATIGEETTPTKTGSRKVKSKLGPLKFRPGWHAGLLPFAHQIGEGGPRGKPANRRPNEVWAEVEVSADVDWQTEANSRASIIKSGPNKGKMNPAEAQIDDQLPLGGHYEYNTSSNVKGTWVIAGDMQVVRVLDDAEVAEINAAEGVADLPRAKPASPAASPTLFQSLATMPTSEFISSQAGITMDQLYARVDEYTESIHGVINSVYADLNALPILVQPKLREASEAKIKIKGYPDASRMTDVVRSGIALDTVDGAQTIVAAFEAKFGTDNVLDEGWSTSIAMYTDRKVLIRFDNGSIGEIQVRTKAMHFAKDEAHSRPDADPGGEVLYKRFQKLAPGDPEAFALLQGMQQVYAPALLASGPELTGIVLTSEFGNIVDQIFSDMGLPLSTTEAIFTASQFPSGDIMANAPAGVSTAGRSSQLSNISSGNIAQSITDALSKVNVDPLQEGGPWREQLIRFKNEDGTVGTMKAGEAFDIIKKRQKAAAALRECVVVN